jgi:hypothetical protein
LSGARGAGEIGRFTIADRSQRVGDAARRIGDDRRVTARPIWPLAATSPSAAWLALVSTSLLASLLALLLASLPACAHATTDAPIANHGKRGPSAEIRTIDWQNHTYQLAELGAVTVKAGHADFAISDDNKAVEIGTGNGSYAVERPLFADVNGDGADDAIISSVLATGGTGHFSEIRIYTLRDGKVGVLAEIPGGDRGDGGIRRVVLDGTALIVERNVLVEGDGLCCPSAAQRERWIWKAGEMAEDASARRSIEP